MGIQGLMIGCLSPVAAGECAVGLAAWIGGYAQGITLQRFVLSDYIS